MTFHDLPEDFASRPITDPDIFLDAIDLLASDASREQGALLFLLTDDEGHLRVPVEVSDVSRSAARETVSEMVSQIIANLPEEARQGIVVLCRRGSTDVTEFDLGLQAHVTAVCAAASFVLHGFAVATSGGVMTIDRPSGSDRLRASA